MPDFPISGPVGVIIMLLLGGLGLPFPEELVLSAGGVAAHPDRSALIIIIAAGWFGVMAGDSLIYALGRFFGGSVIRHPLMARHLSPEKLLRFETYLARRGPKIIFALRFMTGLRAPAYFSAGAMRFPYWKFLAYDGAAATLSVPLLCILGFTMGEHVAAMRQQAKQFGVYAGLAVIGGILLYLGYRWWRGEQGKTTPDEPI